MPGSPAILSPHPPVFNKGNPISLNDDPPFPFISPHLKLQPTHPFLEQDQALLKPRSASTPNTDDSSDSDITSSNMFSMLCFSSSSPPTTTLLLDDSDSKLSSNFVQQFQQAQQERSEAKCHHLQYGYWKENEKANSSLAECQHQLAMQHEQYANEEAMVAQELEKMKLTVKLEELQGQNLALQKRVAGGGDQGPLSTNEDVHKLNNSL
ncbi:hypothetical protein F5J12DRAFT_900666 [Pisolithus orientalis]|uniref:uncharacterized protein n=1 Tax=Pisolithus orientalis TaxID=936130 RepID=UPI002225AD19|nr:uncharacterized protein F5J12DRAFT_900666 [Pisolithus orientalis]KAI5981692.1 hypothetical protein F5J12DRAFT_900666 [Pisolithus orientalis]